MQPPSHKPSATEAAPPACGAGGSQRRKIAELPAMGKGGHGPYGGVFSYGRFEVNMRIEPRRQLTHRHGFHEIMIFESGAGVYSGDFESFEVAGPAAVLIPSGVVHCWPRCDALRGIVCGFDLEFLRLAARTDDPASILMPPFAPVLPLAAATLAGMMPWITRMEQEWHGDGAGRQDMLRACLLALLVDVRREKIIQTPAMDAPQSTAARIYADFLEELDRRVTHMPSVRDMAAALRVTPDHLSTSLRLACGRNASDLIAERVMLEAKRLLAHSRLGVAETAHALGFESPSYFTRFFRKHAEVSPKEFRLREVS